MKKLFFLMLSFVFAMLIVSCGEKDTPEEDVDNVQPDVTDVTDTADVTVDEDITDTDEDVVKCKLEDSFFDAMPTEWTAFFTLKMQGLINDENATTLDTAFLVDIGATLKGEAMNLGDNQGYYVLSSVTATDGSTIPAVIAVGVGNLTWPKPNQLATLWAGQVFVTVQDLQTWKTQAETEGTVGVTVTGTYQAAIFEVWIAIVGSTQTTRMECIRGLGALTADETSYDGGMFFCLEDNVEFAVGEQMKMMDYAKMLDQDADILAVINTGADGNPLPETDPNYRADVCRCWEADGTTLMDCQDYMDEVNGVTDDDVVPDEATDEVVADDDVILAD